MREKKEEKISYSYEDKTIQLAKIKTTGQMNFKRIVGIINSSLLKRKEYDIRGKQLTIHYNNIYNYLRGYYGEARKIFKAFFLSKEQMEKRIEFYNMVLEKEIQQYSIFFPDEC